jgi:site-specific DNA recombinase
MSLSQKHEGWRLLPRRAYDDGGFSGGTMERRRSSAAGRYRGGQIDVVVVYKVDRLTRSLPTSPRSSSSSTPTASSFVSVTQAFNTTTSMGRLTLNVLLSFAQFEREVTASASATRSPPRRRRACGWAAAAARL